MIRIFLFYEISQFSQDDYYQEIYKNVYVISLTQAAP